MPLQPNTNHHINNIASHINAVLSTYYINKIKENFITPTDIFNITNDYNLSNFMEVNDLKNLKYYGQKALTQFTFCEITFLNNVQSSDVFKTTSCVFLNTQVPEVISKLQPLIDNNNIICVLSDLQTIHFDIHDVFTFNEEIIYDISYLEFALNHHMVNSQLFTESFTKSKTPPIIQLFETINKNPIITELSTLGYTVETTPLLTKLLISTYPGINNETIENILSYFQFIKENLMKEDAHEST